MSGKSNKKVKFEKIVDAIEAANMAPSPGNLSILKFILVENLEIIDKVADTCQQDFIRRAQQVIILCSEPRRVKNIYNEKAEKYTNYHVGAAIENFLLKITDLGLASCWVGYFAEEVLKNVLKIPEETDRLFL